MKFHSFLLFSTANITAIQYTHTQPKNHSYILSMDYLSSPKYGTPKASKHWCGFTIINGILTMVQVKTRESCSFA